MKKGIILFLFITILPIITACTSDIQMSEPEKLDIVELNISSEKNSEIEVTSEEKTQVTSETDNKDSKDSKVISLEPLFEVNYDNGSFCKASFISGSDSNDAVSINNQIKELVDDFNKVYEESENLYTIYDMSYETDRYINILMVVNNPDNYGMGNVVAFCFDKNSETKVNLEDCMEHNMITMDDIEYAYSQFYESSENSNNTYIGITDIHALMDKDECPIYYSNVAVDNELSGTYLSIYTLKYDGDYSIVEPFTPY